jgi:hypothetical protein
MVRIEPKEAERKRKINQKGPVVQLVRIRACHARGREFESRPDRQLKKLHKCEAFFLP